MEQTNAEDSGSLMSSLANIPHHILEWMYKRDRLIQKRYEVQSDHRHINYKRLRPCCSIVNEKTKEVQCKDPEVHTKNPALGKRHGQIHNRLDNGKGQPYHNDLIAGQLRMKRKVLVTNKY